MTPTYDLILLMLERDLPLVTKFLPLFRANLRPARIRVITSPKALDRPEVALLRAAGCEVLDENTVIPGLTLSLVRSVVKAGVGDDSRGGWYFKQILNLAYASTEGPNAYYLTWDTDSIPLQVIDFFDDQGRVLYSRKTENHTPYFRTIERLLGLKKQVDFSFICEHMMFDKRVGRALIDAVMGGQPFEGEAFARAILKAVDWKDAGYTGFAEYETYGTFAHAKFPEKIAFRDLKSNRKGGEYFARTFGPAALFGLSRRFVWCTFETDRLQDFFHFVKRSIRRTIGLWWTVSAVVAHPRRYGEFRRLVRSKL